MHKKYKTEGQLYQQYGILQEDNFYFFFLNLKFSCEATIKSWHEERKRNFSRKLIKAFICWEINWKKEKIKNERMSILVNDGKLFFSAVSIKGLKNSFFSRLQIGLTLTILMLILCYMLCQRAIISFSF